VGFGRCAGSHSTDGYGEPDKRALICMCRSSHFARVSLHGKAATENCGGTRCRVNRPVWDYARGKVARQRPRASPWKTLGMVCQVSDSNRSAVACKAVDAGSIPTPASRLSIGSLDDSLARVAWKGQAAPLDTPKSGLARRVSGSSSRHMGWRKWLIRGKGPCHTRNAGWRQ
jgi:hypothetical protein